MAPRSRKHFVRYGGETIGVGSAGNQPYLVPAFMGEHSCTDETHPGPPFYSGGPLLVKKKKVFIDRVGHVDAFIGASAFYKGRVFVQPFIPSPEPTPTPLIGWGAKGYARTIPTHPVYNLGVSIGELKDLPGMVSQTFRYFRTAVSAGKAYASGVNTVRELLSRVGSAPKAVGDGYLYGAFGLAPMYQDLMYLTQMQEKLRRKLAWLRRHNNKSIRRKVTLDEGSFSEDWARFIPPIATMGPALHTELYGPGPWGTLANIPVTKSYQRRIWFVAKYRYYIPELADKHLIKSMPSGWTSLKLNGIAPDPSIAYKLYPWSWLLDWFSSVGAALSNVYDLARFGVVNEYAYVMCKETFTYEAPGYCYFRQGVQKGFVWQPSQTITLSGKSKTVYEFRQREVASPYGFGITLASLSAYQWSILVALGLSGGGKHSNPRA